MFSADRGGKIIEVAANDLRLAVHYINTADGLGFGLTIAGAVTMGAALIGVVVFAVASIIARML